MKPYYQDDYVTLHHGDCIETMRTMPEGSVDSIVTDPPYGLGFMGKKWDALPPGEEWARECFRVLKPGGHILAFGGTRTWHRLAVAIEDAGFEIRDGVLWLYGSGFPKSHDISKAIDKMAGVKFSASPASGVGFMRDDGRGGYNVTKNKLTREGESTSEAQQWEGWGTALKPAYEPAVMARKPFTGTVAGNVLEHGTGAINVDACRVAHDEPAGKPSTGPHGKRAGIMGETVERHRETTAASTAGRWPANVILDEHTAELLDEQSGTLSAGAFSKSRGADKSRTSHGKFKGQEGLEAHRTDSGGASRFFYVAKAPKSERPNVDGVAHPTVKPLALMRYLAKLVTPAGGTILDPFAGSGTTIEAALIEGYNVIGIERETDYIPLIQCRVNRVTI
ncbi:DNA-methyltransferase [Glutamicibacter sp.]|jgi:DNA modification methylase|uniref:DNA-methyltransferase n=1 Tax=Glutamicibacter sp. TaxID=1931995 RepID=UPI002B45FBE0|nr:site-specific DNA-methyltransferase [Glutamicibacter sp.]HJX77292.1 site-specific DNA-methyltransferase [Glutamicibacter sp.]